MIWFILFIIVIICGCIITYRTAEVNELHKMRAAFENRKHRIEELIRLEHNGGEGKTIEELESEEERGELEGIDDAIQMIDEELNSKKNII